MSNLESLDRHASSEIDRLHPNLTIIVVNFNTKNLLRGCLQSLLQNQTEKSLVVYVVDNASVDGSGRMVEQEFPQVKLIENEQNQGYARANNAVLRNLQTDYALLVNSDIIAPPGAIQGLIDFMEQHPDAAIAGPKLVRPNGEFDPGSKMGFATIENVLAKRVGLAKLLPRHSKFGGYYAGSVGEDEIGSVDAVAGAFMMLRKSALDQIGLFDESFFFGCEDLDLAYRVKHARNESSDLYKVFYYPEVSVTHLGRQTRKRFPIISIVEFHRSSWRMYEKYHADKHGRLFNGVVRLSLIFTGAVRVINAATRLPLRK